MKQSIYMSNEKPMVLTSLLHVGKLKTPLEMLQDISNQVLTNNVSYILHEKNIWLPFKIFKILTMTSTLLRNRYDVMDSFCHMSNWDRDFLSADQCRNSFPVSKLQKKTKKNPTHLWVDRVCKGFWLKVAPQSGSIWQQTLLDPGRGPVSWMHTMWFVLYGTW